MSEKIIIITPDDKLQSADYNGYECLRDAVNGTIEYFATNVELPFLKAEADFVCNDSFLVDKSEEFDKINAVASLLFSQDGENGLEIRGNVAVVLSNGDGSNRGFNFKEGDICEHWIMEDFLEKFINNHKDEITKCHEKHDNNKSAPTLKFEAFELG